MDQKMVLFRPLSKREHRGETLPFFKRLQTVHPPSTRFSKQSLFSPTPFDPLSLPFVERRRKMLLDELIDSGGRVEEIDGVEKLEFKWRKGKFLSPSGDERVWQGDSLILNSPFHRLRNVMGEKKGWQWSKWAKKVQP